jgi:hypothetical protein
MTAIPYGGEGVPGGIDTQEFNYQELLAGHSPEFLTVGGYQADGSVAMAAFTVVGVSGGNLVPATATGTSDVEPIGILPAPILANGQVQKIGLIRGGNFNVDALVFDASFSDAEKLVAFEGAPSPTQIVLQKVG